MKESTGRALTFRRPKNSILEVMIRETTEDSKKWELAILYVSYIYMQFCMFHARECMVNGGGGWLLLTLPEFPFCGAVMQ